MSAIAIIGAGSSGLAAAHTLQDAGQNVTLFEKSRGLGGRAATRKRDGFTYDHGAQYIKQGGAISTELVTARFRAPDLIDIHKPVWTFDSAGNIKEGDSAQNAEPKWSYRSGLTALAKQMAHGLQVMLNIRIDHISQDATGWHLFDTTGQSFGPFAHVLITIPAPQARELLEKSQIAASLHEIVETHLSRARYNPLISVMLGFRPTPRTRPYYALVNTDKAHPISWLAWEHEKARERVPEGTGLLIAQMAPQYSQTHWKAPNVQQVIGEVAHLVSNLLDEPLTTPIFTDIQHWLYALPSEKVQDHELNTRTRPYGITFCGDAFVGGRIHLALEHGIAIAQQLIDGGSLQ